MSFSVAGSGGAGMPSPEQVKAMRAKLEERAFAAADKNGDSSITKAELAAARPKDAPADAPSADQIFDRVDSDKDGKITKTEFSAFGDKLASQLGGLQAAGDLPQQGPAPGKAADAYKAQQGLLATLSSAKTDDANAGEEIAKVLKTAFASSTA